MSRNFYYETWIESDKPQYN